MIAAPMLPCLSAIMSAIVRCGSSYYHSATPGRAKICYAEATAVRRFFVDDFFGEVPSNLKLRRACSSMSAIFATISSDRSAAIRSSSRKQRMHSRPVCLSMKPACGISVNVFPMVKDARYSGWGGQGQDQSFGSEVPMS